MGEANRRTQIGRLAMRVEGENWVAYYAKPDTMDKAIWLGSIKMGIVSDDRWKAAFMDLMRAVIGDMLEGKTGQVADWIGAMAAPEHERAGRA